MNKLVITDEDLMRKFCAGDMSSFELLYARHEKPLYRYVRRVMGSALAMHVEDVFQDTWMRLVDGRNGWQARDNASFKTWLYTLAHHRAIDLLRKDGREISVDDGWLESDAEAPWQLWPASSAEQPEQQAQLKVVYVMPCPSCVSVWGRTCSPYLAQGRMDNNEFA